MKNAEVLFVEVFNAEGESVATYGMFDSSMQWIHNSWVASTQPGSLDHFASQALPQIVSQGDMSCFISVVRGERLVFSFYKTNGDTCDHIQRSRDWDAELQLMAEL
jgi:hypothetical protein